MDFALDHIQTDAVKRHHAWKGLDDVRKAEDRATGHLQHRDCGSPIQACRTSRVASGRDLVRIERIGAFGRIADRRPAVAKRTFENAEIKPRRFIVGDALRSRDRLARRNAANPVATGNRSDLKILVLVFEFEVFAGEPVGLKRTERDERLVGRLIGANDAKSGEAVAVVDDGIDPRIFAEKRGDLLLNHRRVPIGYRPFLIAGEQFDLRVFLESVDDAGEFVRAHRIAGGAAQKHDIAFAMQGLRDPFRPRGPGIMLVPIKIGDIIFAFSPAGSAAHGTTFTPASVAARSDGSCDLPQSGMMASASMPSETRPLTSEIDFCRSPWPMRITCLTLAHFAASDRTAAIDARDQPLTPNPSWMPSVIFLVPQNEVVGGLGRLGYDLCGVIRGAGRQQADSERRRPRRAPAALPCSTTNACVPPH